MKSIIINETLGTAATKVNKDTKQGNWIMWDFENARYNDIYAAYEKPSKEKVDTFNEIKRRAIMTPGYNHDLKVAGRGTWTYSTVYSYTIDGITTIVKDTKSNIFAVVLD